MVVVQQGGPGGGGGGRSGGNRQVRRNFDPSKMDTAKLDPETRSRMREFQTKLAERNAKGGAEVEASRRWVLVKEGSKITPRQVLAGISNLDQTEIISGLEEGAEVIAQPTSMLAKEREEMMQRFRSFGGIPGMGGGGGGSRR